MRSQCCKGLDALLGAQRAGGASGSGSSWLIGGLDLGLDPVTQETVNRRMARDLMGATQPGQTYLVLHVDDPKGLVAHEKGAGVAWAAMALVPEYVNNEVYSQIASQMKEQFREKGSEVTIDIVQTPPKGEKPTSDLKGGILVGLLLAALGWGAVKLVSKVPL